MAYKEVVIPGNILTQFKFHSIHLLRLWYIGNVCIGVVTKYPYDQHRNGNGINLMSLYVNGHKTFLRHQNEYDSRSYITRWLKVSIMVLAYLYSG
jgi:hypothetical protein